MSSLGQLRIRQLFVGDNSALQKGWNVYVLVSVLPRVMQTFVCSLHCSSSSFYQSSASSPPISISLSEYLPLPVVYPLSSYLWFSGSFYQSVYLLSLVLWLFLPVLYLLSLVPWLLLPVSLPPISGSLALSTSPLPSSFGSLAPTSPPPPLLSLCAWFSKRYSMLGQRQLVESQRIFATTYGKLLFEIPVSDAER